MAGPEGGSQCFELEHEICRDQRQAHQVSVWGDRRDMIRGAEEPLGRAYCEMLGGMQSAASGRLGKSAPLVHQ